MCLAVAIFHVRPGSSRIGPDIPLLLLEAASRSPERQRAPSVVGSLGGFLPGAVWRSTGGEGFGLLHKVGSRMYIHREKPSQGCWMLLVSNFSSPVFRGPAKAASSTSETTAASTASVRVVARKIRRPDKSDNAERECG